MQQTARNCEKISILVVEDEWLIVELVAEALSDQGFVVQTAGSADEALRKLASAPVDVLFSDIELPGSMDGAALARRVRAMLPDISVVYASAKVALLPLGSRVPGALFVAKPYEPRRVGELIAAMNSARARVPA